MPPRTVGLMYLLLIDLRCCSSLSAADIVLWKCKRATVGVIFGATIAWWLFEKSELSFLTICCDVLLILIVVQLIWVKISGLLNKQPRQLPELVLSEEMVNNAAASFRVKVNNMLMIAHDITLGKDFRLFFQGCVSPVVAICYWQFLLFCNSCLYRNHCFGDSTC
uniref:Reticulon-like protein n=1 Tax=Aegilops tauschii subsp. strangulata TaxID=200361 RepID=A0A453I5B0_AEGTS